MNYNPSLTTVSISDLPALQTLRFQNGAVGALTILNCPAIEYITCTANNLTSIDVTQFPILKDLGCGLNQITELDLSNNPQLEFLAVFSNPISEIDLSHQSQVKYLYCHETPISTIDVSAQHLLTNFYAYDCPNLTSVFMKNNFNFNIVSSQGYPGYDLHDLPNLEYVCVEESKIPLLEAHFAPWGMTDVNLNSYCSFNPGGEFFTISGNIKFDETFDGCDTADLGASNIVFAITNGTTTGGFSAGTAGNYSIPVIAGTHTITPQFENPSYFSVTPPSVNLTFDTSSTDFVQDFCVTANGEHLDLEIAIIPLTTAVAGFDTQYKLVYKNKGTETVAGSVNFTFDDTVLNFVTSTPAYTTQAPGMLSWNFSELAPFESREIILGLQLNTPTDIPPLNAGDQLTFTASIPLFASDETPSDNTFTLHQQVFNSYDPNDKTCLQGDTITPEMVGQFVHYIIRFENTGNFPAQNIVVRDIIDLAKFDMATLAMVSASHAVELRVSSGNKVEFIFENIQLPFDDANNDGYVAFKIKTLPTLVIGDTFSNLANIYFDYNFPIITNTAATTIAALENADFEFSQYFTLYPNPATNELHIHSGAIGLTSVRIYNIMGQLVLTIPNALQLGAIDVSDFKSGTYYVRVESEIGSSSGKFMKR